MHAMLKILLFVRYFKPSLHFVSADIYLHVLFLFQFLI